MNLFSLESQIAFVTGAGSGIGQRIAIGLAEAGADVALFDLPDSAGVGETAAAITRLGRRAIPLSGDVVDGEAIDRYCDEHKLDVEARVRLFLDVLAAVAHAHVNLRVHRDITPSNVLGITSG